MHEWTIADRILRIVSGEVDELKGSVKSIHIRIGESMTLSRDALRNALRVLGKDRGHGEFNVTIQTVPVSVSCSSCQYEGDVPKADPYQFHQSVPILDCPRCNAPAEVTEGGDITVHRIALENE